MNGKGQSQIVVVSVGGLDVLAKMTILCCCLGSRVLFEAEEKKVRFALFEWDGEKGAWLVRNGNADQYACLNTSSFHPSNPYALHSLNVYKVLSRFLLVVDHQWKAWWDEK